jgi:hypothetical protein
MAVLASKTHTPVTRSDIIFYLHILCLACCVLSNGIPLIPSRVIKKKFSLNTATTLIVRFFLPDLLQQLLWSPLVPVLDDAGFLALYQHEEPSVRRAIRKAESTSSVLKGLLKVPPTLVTIVLVLGHLGFSIWISLPVAVSVLSVMGLIRHQISSEVVRVVQGRKSTREDDVYVPPFFFSIGIRSN